MSTSEIATVLAWHDALNGNDVDTVLALSSDDIEVGSADGAAQGLEHLQEWVRTPGVTLTPGAMFYRDGVVVVEESATSDDESAGTTMEAASFRVVHDHVTSIFRHTDLESALSATGMSESDRVAES
ncbi:nuclear transport factor 2 family protein [Rhodococcus sp. PAMC28707]|uniref:nuclear transport factor 2 family protein n=1 Tax=unclassified Rhodococcus (in: high G+C Gram-positive bacteria) TaxID=192944 RepID=UPI00109DB800|nr:MULTISPECIES: nuclear transport factor 2 family protein [unclassified Rhodococcus (in: high G+C Gram-positive bacteria)]QCB50411.1 nuclear transport factor 2 family protein [Rhodococcus sp. PAMC28705]QCB57897.1 nuclear transport factor 2 family protein [Rhodococcus sp. PAMC28707]